MMNFISFAVLYTLICQVSFLRSQSPEYILDEYILEPDYTADLVDDEIDLSLEITNSRDKQFYFVVLLYYKGKYRCLASLISDRLILTAIHCVKNGTMLLDPGYFSGHAAGAKEGIIPHAPIQFVSIHVLPEGNLAILVTKENAAFGGGVERICLLDDTTKELIYHDAVAATVESPNEDTLKFPHVKLVNKSYCGIQETSKICVYGGNTTLCKGDSGGPLTVTKKKDVSLQIGILLHAATRGGQTREGKDCNNLVIYDRVSQYRKFISQIAKSSNSNVCFDTL